jgi:tryptophan synthase alpha chain
VSAERFECIFTAVRKRRAQSGAAGCGCALIPFIMAGDPTLSATAAIVRELDTAGADIIELGVPFSDPVADGPVIQRAGERALRQGTTLERVLGLVADLRPQVKAALLLFGYFNPLLRYGMERFAHDAAAAGVDGMLTIDVIPEESEQYCRTLDAHDLAHVFLAAPTSPDERLRAIADRSTGFIYAVSRMGVTGSRDKVPPGAREVVARLRAVTSKPVALGFGISTPAQVEEVGLFADAAVVGTALVDAIDGANRAGGETHAAEAAGRFVAALAGGGRDQAAGQHAGDAASRRASR